MHMWRLCMWATVSGLKLSVLKWSPLTALYTVVHYAEENHPQILQVLFKGWGINNNVVEVDEAVFKMDIVQHCCIERWNVTGLLDRPYSTESDSKKNPRDQWKIQSWPCQPLPPPHASCQISDPGSWKTGSPRQSIVSSIHGRLLPLSGSLGSVSNYPRTSSDYCQTSGLRH